MALRISAMYKSKFVKMHNEPLYTATNKKKSHAQKYTKTDKNININYNKILDD